MTEIKDLLIKEFGEAIILDEVPGLMPIIKVPSTEISKIADFLKNNENCYFDSLSCITGIDNGPEKDTMELMYVLNSIPFGHKITLQCVISRNTAGGDMPTIPTVSNVWHSANWDEREIFDLLGIEFIGHPNMRRILMPEDWLGYPLRKDYLQQETYHGITVKY
jgi:NADH-quinone oxidoreductase subunit C